MTEDAEYHFGKLANKTYISSRKDTNQGALRYASKVMVARDLNRWLERNKHLAQDITRRQRSPNPHDSRRR